MDWIFYFFEKSVVNTVLLRLMDRMQKTADGKIMKTGRQNKEPERQNIRKQNNINN